MPRPAKPWWDSSKKQWACRHGGRYVALGTGSFTDASKAFHRLKAESESTCGETDSVSQVIERYLRHVKASKRPKTYQSYQSVLSGFYGFVGEKAVADLLPDDLQQWLDQQPKTVRYKGKKGKAKTRKVTWTDTTKASHASIVKQSFAWARRMRIIAENPLADFQLPMRRRREGIVSDDAWAKVLAATKGPFRDLLEFCRATGCRPQEVRAIEVHHVGDGYVRFPTSESKMRRRPRTIYLDDQAAAIVRKLIGTRTTGFVFRNRDGGPWTKDSIRGRLRTTKTGFNLGMLRKTWVTDALQKLPLAIVAELAGHTAATALQHYSHLGEKVEALKAAAKVAGKR